MGTNTGTSKLKIMKIATQINKIIVERANSMFQELIGDNILDGCRIITSGWNGLDLMTEGWPCLV